MKRVLKHSKRVAIAIVGGCIVLLGIVMIPYPGPGWVVVFTGLAVLSTEFDWAQRLLDRARGLYDAWQSWMKRQDTWVQVVAWLLTALVVVVTIWLFNGYGLVNQWFDLGLPFLMSPFF